MSKILNVLFSVLTLVALVTSLTAYNKVGSGASAQSLSDRVIEKGEIRVGYIVYPPLLAKDATTGQLSGISYDLVEAAAKNLNLKTNWVEEASWGTAIEGLKTGRYDIVGTQMWPNSARAREGVFSVAPMNSEYFPYVKTGDNRFKEGITDLKSGQYIISTLDGEMASVIAKTDYPTAKTIALPQTSSLAEMYLNVASGKADITFHEQSGAAEFLKAHPGSIEKVGDTPVRVFGNSFVFERGEDSMVSMWNIAMGELINDGTVARTLEKYGQTHNYSINR